MGNFSCPVITPAIQEIYAEIRRLYPEGSSSVNLDVKRVATWVDMYASANNIPIDNVTKKDAKAVVNHAEKCLNMDGKSFKKVETSTVNSNELLGPETKINIYAGTNENADLSNFAERPLNFGKVTAYSLPEGSKVGAFTSKYPIYHIGESTYSTKQNPESGDSFVFDGLSDLFSGRRFKTVEGAFQAAKLVFTHPKGNGAKGNKYWQPKEYTQRENSIDGVYYNTANVFVFTDEGEQLLQKFQEASGAQARSLGRQIEGLDRQEWDANSSKIMKAVIGRSFEANPQALQRLLATGNATLTHTQDKGKWGKEFPRLLMEVRDELRKEASATSNTPQKETEDISSFSFYSGGATGSDTEWKKAIEGRGGKVRDYIVKDYDTLPKEEKDKIEKEYQEVVAAIKRKPLSATSFSGKLVRRDMMQADSADAVFAIGTYTMVRDYSKPDNTTDPTKSVHSYKPQVNGGTAYAVQRAIQRGIPVYFFDQDSGKWLDLVSFKSIDTPTLTPKAAVIGTREITGAGKQAIQDVLDKTFGETKYEDIPQQLIDHLKAMGATVLNQVAMKKFFDEHPNTLIQQAFEEQWEIQEIKAKAIADGTFMKAPNGKPTNLTERQWLQVRTKNFINWFGDWLHQNPEEVITSEKETVNRAQNWVDGSKVILENGKYYYTNELGTKKEITEQEYNNFNAGKDIVLSEKTRKEKKYNHSKVLDKNGEPLVMYHVTTTKDIRIFDRAKSEHGGFWFSRNPNYYVKDSQHNPHVAAMPCFLNIREPNEIEHNIFLDAVDGDVTQETLDNTRFDGWITRYEHKPEFYEDTYSESAPIFAMVTSPNQIKSANNNNGEFSTENDDIQMFITPEGEIYGFVDKDGNIYLDETIIDASHPIHEYTHLWDRALAKINPKLWQKGVKLMQEGVPAIWNEIANSEQYGKLWQSKGIKGERLTNLIASEVHARLVGENGAKLLDSIAKEKGKKGIVAKLKQWILDAWKELKKTFSNWSQEEIDKLTLKDFNHMTVRDFADGINPNTISSPSPASGSSNLTDGAVGFDAAEAKAESDRLKQQRAERIQAEANKPKPERPKSVSYESALDVRDSPIAQFKRTFSPQQIKDRGAMISDMFSDVIDEALWDEIDHLLDNIDNMSNIIEDNSSTEEQKAQAEQKKIEAKQRLKAIKDPVKGRQLIAQEKGIPVIIDAIKQRIQDNMDSAPEDKKQLWENILEYNPDFYGDGSKTVYDAFSMLFNSQASLDIEEREGIRIIGLEFNDKTASEEETEEQDNGDDEVGHVVSGADGWMFQVRFTDPFSSLSKKVRSMLYEVARPESEKDDLGQTRYYPMGQIYATLLTYLSRNVETADDFLQVVKDFEELPEALRGSWTTIKDQEDLNYRYPNGYPVFPALENLSKAHPWVSQIIDRLTDDYLEPESNTNSRYPSTGGAMASQMYRIVQRFIPYGKIQIGTNPKTGKPYFNVTPLNYEMEDKVQYDKLEANYNNRMILTEHSAYNSDGTINKENAQWLKKEIGDVVNQLDRRDFREIPELLEYDQNHPDEDNILSSEDVEEYNSIIDRARHILQSFGIDATQDSVVSYLMMGENGSELRKIISDLDYVADRILKVDDARIPTFNYIIDLENPYKEPVWKHFFDGRGMITDASYMQSFYDSASKKTKYSYSADNYLMKTFRGVCMGSKEKRQRYIDEHFGKFEWFKNQNTGEWRNKWLEFWYNYDGELKEIPYKNIDNITEYSDDGTAVVRPYSKWIKDDIWQVQERSYEADSKKNTAFYLAPIFSDSPMSMTVMGPRMSMEELLFGYTDSNNIRHQGALVQLVNQELWRIQYVQERAKAIEEGRLKEIANFDGKRGLQFCFLPELNDYTFDADESRDYPEENFLDRMIHMKKDGVTSKEIEALQIQAITDILNAKMYEYMHDNSKHYEKEPISPEQYYNMVYANAAIIQMTTIDLAFYKSYDNFQKRFKEVYAGGIQLNTNSKYGKKTENVVILSDDIITSPSYEKIAKAIESSKNLSQKDKDDIKALFKKVNLADAQAIRAMHSFKSVLDMMGNWTDEMEQALQRFKEGTWDRVDFDTIYQIIKPFVYTVIERNDGKGGSILVPQQHKNSEICALMMYDLINNSLDNSPVYKALSRFMDENTDANGEHLIDMIQFESAGKVGNQGTVNISVNPTKVVKLIEQEAGEEYPTISTAFIEKENGNIEYLPNDTDHAVQNFYGDNKYKGKKIKGSIKEQLDDMLESGKISQDKYKDIMRDLRPTEEEIISMLEQATLITNPDGTKSINTEVVHTIPFDNYYQQQPTPEHYQDEEIMAGSQSKNIAVADLPEDFEMTLKGKKGSKTFKGKDAIIDFYYELMNENLLEDFFGKGNKKGLKGIFASKKDLADAVTDIVRGNPKYGADFAEALQLDDDGNYVLNPNSPTVFTMMQEIVTSFFKNRITKQKIDGAALIQAAGIGLDEDLRLQFDEDGKLKGIECYMPITSKKLFEPLLKTDKDGNKYFDINSLPENMKEAVGYRIPTENKSSMAPLIIKGFTPLQNGSAIILPAEITTIAGSDFDVDKMYVMLSSFTVITHDKRKAFEAYTKEEHKNAQETINALGKANIEDLEVDEIGENFAKWFKIHGDDYLLDTPKIKKIEYDFSKTPKENGRKARNNMVIQLMYGILTSKEGTEQVLNPQGFRDVKRAAKIARILTDNSLLDQLIENTSSAASRMIPSAETIVSEFLDIIQQRYPDQYEDYKRAVLKMPTEEIQAAYIKAVTAGSNKEAINLLLNASTDDLEDFIDRYSTPESPAYPQTFAKVHARNMAGVNQLGIYAIQGSMAAKYQRATVRLTEKQQFTINGRRVANVDMSEGGKRLKNVGQMIGASADNGKDSNLSDMGSTEKTAPIIGYMLRLGLSPLEAALVINQGYMKNSGYSSKKEKYWKDILGKNLLAFPVENVTTDMLIKNLISPFELSEDEKKSIAGMCYRILCQKEAQEYLTRISRADSVNGAMQNSYAKARMLQYRVDLFQAKMGQEKTFPFERIKEAVSNTAIDVSAPEDVIREQLKGQRMGLLHGMYALGVNSFQDLVAPYFFGARKWFDDRIVKPILYNLSEVKANKDGEKIIDNIYKSYITFMLSGSDLFGNEEGASMKNKRDYYLETFPSDYQKILQENEDIKDLLSTVLQVKNFGSRKRVILQDVGSLTKGQKQDVQRRFEDLMYSSNPVAQKLAKDLLIYSYFDNGLQFTHDSFSHLFTTGFLTKFPTYTDTLNRLEKEISQEEEENFIAQFLLTYPEAAYKVDDIIDKDKNIDPDGNIKIDLNDKSMYKYMVNEVMSPNPRHEINVYSYISYEGEIYMLDKEMFKNFPGGPVYRKIEGYDTHSRLPLFSVEMSVSKMAQEFPVGNESQQETPSLGEDDRIPAAHNEGEGNPNVAPDSMYTSFEGMDDSFEFADYADASMAEEKSPSEQYDDEGKGELQDPFC